MRSKTLWDDHLTDCYQAVSHLIDHYGTASPSDGTSTFATGELQLIRAPGHTTVKFQGKEVLCVPEGGQGQQRMITFRPCKSWLDEIDRMYEEIEFSFR